MKIWRFLLRFLMVVAFLMLLPILALAGVVTPTLPDLPGTFNPADYFLSFLGYVATVVALTALFNRLLKWKDWNKRLLSWGVILVTGFLAYFMSWGIFDNTLINSIVIMLFAALGGHLGYHGLKLILIDFGVLPEKKQ